MKGSSDSIEQVAVVSKPNNPQAVRISIQIIKYLKENKIKATPEYGLAEKAGLKNAKDFSELYCDAIVTVGGDGTVLRTCMNIPEPETPILAINMGRRGYLTETRPEQAIESMSRLLKGEYHIERHSKISVYLNQEYLGDGLNEAIVSSSSPSKMLRFQISLGEAPLITTRGDGLIVSTPTGSTAHAFSAGGPVLYTQLEAFNIVFLSSIDPIKAFIAPFSKKIQIKLQSGIGAILAIDGCLELPASIGSTITIEGSKYSAKFIRFRENFIARSLGRLIKGGIEEED